MLVLVVVAVVMTVLVDVIVEVINVTSVMMVVSVVVNVCTGPPAWLDDNDDDSPGDPEQRPYNGLQPAPQWSGVEPHQPEAEQQSPKEERWHVIPSEQRPSGLTSRLWAWAVWGEERKRRMDVNKIFMKSRIVFECLDLFKRQTGYIDWPVNSKDTMA